MTKLKPYLLLWVGEEGRDIFSTFTFALGVGATADAPAIPAESNKSLDTVYGKFKEYVTPKLNVIFARYKFYNRVQGSNEPVDQFVTDVKLLIKGCGNPSTVEDEMVHDRLAYGTNSQKVCEKFINHGSDLNLKSAIDIARAHESAMAQLKKVSGDSVSVDGVKSKRKTSKRLATIGIQFNSQTAKSKPTGKPTAHKCGYCGYSVHKSMTQCRARGPECKNCGKKSFQFCMPFKEVQVVTSSADVPEESATDYDFFIDAVHSDSNKNQVFIDIKLTLLNLK